MSAESVAGWKPTPIGFTKGAATRSERNLGARPPTLRYLAKTWHETVETPTGKLDVRRTTGTYVRPGRAEAKAAAAARKAARRAYADALKTQVRAVRRNVLALERSIAVM